MCNHQKHAKNQGFTLVEILVALFIFAIIGVLTATSLHAMMRTHTRLKAANEQILKLDITMTLLRRDLLQAIDRPIRDTDGNVESAFVGTGSSQLTFTRTGLIDPFHTSPQSNMQRVAYTLGGGNLVRLTWDVLDQPPKMKPEAQILLKNVTSVKWQFIADNGTTSNMWPPSTGTNMQKENSDLPKAVLMLMHVQNQGIVQGVFPVPARGLNENTQAP